MSQGEFLFKEQFVKEFVGDVVVISDVTKSHSVRKETWGKPAPVGTKGKIILENISFGWFLVATLKGEYYCVKYGGVELDKWSNTK